MSTQILLPCAPTHLLHLHYPWASPRQKKKKRTLPKNLEKRIFFFFFFEEYFRKQRERGMDVAPIVLQEGGCAGGKSFSMLALRPLPSGALKKTRGGGRETKRQAFLFWKNSWFGGEKLLGLPFIWTISWCTKQGGDTEQPPPRAQRLSVQQCGGWCTPSK